MPWTVMRNFIRAFCPTLILVINWDLWRNLGRAEPAKQWAIMTDAVASVLFWRYDCRLP